MSKAVVKRSFFTKSRLAVIAVAAAILGLSFFFSYEKYKVYRKLELVKGTLFSISNSAVNTQALLSEKEESYESNDRGFEGKYFRELEPPLFAIVYEGEVPEFLYGKERNKLPLDNSWRSNLCWAEIGGGSAPNLYNISEEWHTLPNKTWKYWRYSFENKDKPPYAHWTNLMTITGESSITDSILKKKNLSEPSLNDFIILVEVVDYHHHWAKRGDVDINSVDDYIIPDRYKRGLIVVFRDYKIWSLSKDVSVDELKTFMTYEGALNNDRDVVLKKYLLGETDDRRD